MKLRPIVFLDLDDTLNNFTETVCKLRKVDYKSIEKYEDLFLKTKLTHSKLARLVNSNKYLETISSSEVARSIVQILSLYKDELIIKIITARKYLGEGAVSICRQELFKLSDNLGDGILLDVGIIICERREKWQIIGDLSLNRNILLIDDNEDTLVETKNYFDGMKGTDWDRPCIYTLAAPAPWNGNINKAEFDLYNLNTRIQQLLGH